MGKGGSPGWGGGVFIGVPSSPGIKPELERLSENGRDVPAVRFCGRELPTVNISGLGTGDGQLDISGN